MTAWLLLVLVFVAANLPWLSERFLFFITPKGGQKREWMRLVELLLLYFLCGALVLAVEYRSEGGVHAQDWEFYVVTFCLFVIFALPGFIYHHDLKKILKRLKTHRKA